MANPEAAVDAIKEKAWGLEAGERPPETGRSYPGPHPAIRALLAREAVAQSARQAWWDLQLNAPVNPVEGEQAVMTVEVIGTSPGAVDIEWMIGNSVSSSGPGAHAFTPEKPGALAISIRGKARSTL